MDASIIGMAMSWACGETCVCFSGSEKPEQDKPGIGTKRVLLKRRFCNIPEGRLRVTIPTSPTQAASNACVLGIPSRERLNLVRPPDEASTGKPVSAKAAYKAHRVALTAAASLPRLGDCRIDYRGAIGSQLTVVLAAAGGITGLLAEV